MNRPDQVEIIMNLNTQTGDYDLVFFNKSDPGQPMDGMWLQRVAAAILLDWAKKVQKQEIQ